MRGVAATGAALVVFAACGGASTLTKQQYAARLNSACADFAKGEKAIGEPHSLDDVAARGPRIAALFAATIERTLAGLRPPPAFVSLHARLFSLARQQHRVLVALARAARRSDLATFGRLVTRNSQVNEAAAAVAPVVGASACGR